MSEVSVTTPWERFNFMELLRQGTVGEGAFGKVWVTQSLINEQHYAVKRVPLNLLLENLKDEGISLLNDEGSIDLPDRHSTLSDLLRIAKAEVDVHKNIRSQFVVNYYGYWIEGEGVSEVEGVRKVEDRDRFMQLLEELDISSTQENQGPSSGYLFIQLERCEFGSLQDLFDSKTFPPREIPRLFSNLAKGLAAIHAKGIIHRDLKPANILCSKGADVEDTYYIWKIGDFGLATFVNKGKENLEEVGTFVYRSPEMYTGQPYGKKTDVYSLGLVYLETIARPLEGKRAVFLALKNGTRPPSEALPSSTGRRRVEYDDLITRMLTLRPEDRCSTDDVLAGTAYPVQIGWAGFTIYPRASQTFSGVLGREKEVTSALEWAESNRPVALILHGPRGIGKRMFLVQLLLAVGKKHAYKNNVLWLDMTNDVTWKSVLRTLARRLDVEFGQDIDPKTFRTCLASLKEWSREEIYCFIQNAPSADAISWILPTLHEFGIPVAISSVMTKEEFGTIPIYDTITIDVPPFTLEEAKTYVRTMFPNLVEGVTDLDLVLESYCSTLACHPLSLYISSQIPAYKHRSNQERLEEPTVVKEFWLKEFRPGLRQKLNAFEVAECIALLQRFNVLRMDRLEFHVGILEALAFCHPDGLSTDDMFDYFRRPLTLDMSAVASYMCTIRLVERKRRIQRDDPHGIQIHPSFAEALRELFHFEGRESNIVETVLSNFRHTLNKPSTLLHITNMILHVRKHASAVLDETADIILETAEQLSTQNNSLVSYEFAFTCAETFRKVYGLDHLQTSKMETYVVRALRKLDRHEEALELVLDIENRCTNPELLELILLDKVLLLETLGRVEESEKVFLKCATDSPPSHRMDSFHGFFLWRHKKFAEVRQIYDTILQSSPNDPYVEVISMSNIACCWMAEGNITEAKSNLIRAFHHCIRTLGKTHELFLHILQNFADLLTQTGETSMAVQVLEHIRESQAKEFGESHDSVRRLDAGIIEYKMRDSHNDTA